LNPKFLREHDNYDGRQSAFGECPVANLYNRQFCFFITGSFSLHTYDAISTTSSALLDLNNEGLDINWETRTFRILSNDAR
jgi:hypothetical protein